MIAPAGGAIPGGWSIFVTCDGAGLHQDDPMPRYRALALLGLLALGCVHVTCDSKSADDAKSHGGTKPAAAGKSSGPPGTREPVPCESDADCPRLACGPCTPGRELTQWDIHIDCKMNPCDNGDSVCGPANVCVVSPGTSARIR